MYRAQHFGWTPARTAVAMNEINERKDASKKRKKKKNPINNLSEGDLGQN